MLVSKYQGLFQKPLAEDLTKLGLRVEEDLIWFEDETLKYLIIFFQKGYFVFLDNIIKESKIEIDNITPESTKEIFDLSYLKFISQKVSFFRTFLNNWSRKISINSIDNPIILNNQIEGKILWKETFRERNYLRYPKSIKFVCSSYKNNYDSLENIIIKSYLVFLRDLINNYSNYLKEYERSKYKKEDWRFHTISIKDIINKILANYYMREISYLKKAWNNKYNVSSALRSCNRTNYLLLLYANLYHDLKNPELLEYFLLNYVLKPNQDRTAELFVLFNIINKISSYGDGKEDFFIIKTKKQMVETEKEIKPVYIKEFNDEREIRLYYQLKPDWLKINYPERLFFTKTLIEFNLQNKELHPDITIEIIDGDKRKIILIEVKNSNDSSYIRQGLLQICNYYEYLKRKNNSSWVEFGENKTNLKKEGFLISREIPKEWKVDINEIWNNNDLKIKYFDFKSLKEFDSSAFVSRLLDFRIS